MRRSRLLLKPSGVVVVAESKSNAAAAPQQSTRADLDGVTSKDAPLLTTNGSGDTPSDTSLSA